jgi:hypothetical protein
MRVLEMQVPDTKVTAPTWPLASVRALGQASSVAPLKKVSAPDAARLVTCEVTSLAPGLVGLHLDLTVMSEPSMAA